MAMLALADQPKSIVIWFVSLCTHWAVDIFGFWYLFENFSQQQVHIAVTF